MDNQVLELRKFLEENMLTKEEANNFLTKNDAKNIATKNDLKNFVTQDQLTQGLQQTRDEIMSVVATRYDINDLKIMIEQLRIRTDEDLRVVMKDVELLKPRQLN